MDFNEWAKYSGIGSTCEYDDRTMQFIEQYNNATFQTYMDNERKNRTVQKPDTIGAERGQVLPTNGKRENGAISIHQGQRKVYTKMFRWARLALDFICKSLKRTD